MSELTQRALEVRLQQDGPIPLDVTLTCQQGELLALVGPSGSGKSTILRSIAGLYRPRHGVITCGGERWLDTEGGIEMRPQQRRVGLMFQHYALFPHLTALNNVKAALGHIPEAEREDRAQGFLGRVHLSGMRDRRPGKLSGGEQQRVALARALAREPKVLLLDEPFSAVDQVTRRKLRLELMALIRALSIPIILVTHDLDEACMLARRMCILRAGRTLQEGAPQEVMQRPRNAEIARLMDVRNIFQGEIATQGEDGATRLKWRDELLVLPYCSNYQPGAAVTWCIPPEQVLLHRRDRPASRGAKENPVEGTVLEIVTIGGISSVLLALDHEQRDRLHMDLPPHVVQRNQLRIGDTVSMSLLGESIHLMPWQEIGPRSHNSESAA